MSNSLPSKKAVVLDVPQVKNFRATFVYNFFTPDEQVNDTAEVPDYIKRLPAESFDAARIDEVRRVIPRFVRFDFSRVQLQGDSLSQNEFVQNPNPSQAQNEYSIRDNLAQIQLEEQFSGHDYTGLEFQDNNVDRKLYTLVSGSVAKRVAAKNRSIHQEIDDQRKTVLSSLTDQYSLLDAAKALADESSDGVSNNVVVRALARLDALKLSLIDDATQQELINDEFSEVRNVAVRGQLSNRIVGRVIRNVINDPMSTFADEFSQIQPRADAEQQRAIARHNPRIVNSAEFETTFNAIDRQSIDVHDYPTSTKILGYIIEKYEALPNGQLKSHPPIILESANISTAIDQNVAYGRNYVYTIRTIAQLKCRTSVDDSDDIVLSTGLVSSPRSSRVFVTCFENVPPPTVTDFNITWDYTQGIPVLSWTFPPNRQRDIKKFQILKRMSTSEPFQLVKQLDFDDSVIKTSNAETPDPLLVSVIKEPVTTYSDLEFLPGSSPIYTICCIDAHGLSSGYSMQLQVTFDAFKNRLNKKVISFAGAPKSYPNLLLNTELFVDTMKVSGHTRIRVIFDPEYLNVTDAAGNDLQLLTKQNIDGGKYRLQIINTDVQRESVVDIKINDLRLAKDRQQM